MSMLSVAIRLVCLVLLPELADADGKKVSVKEVVFDSAVADIQWLGSDQTTVLVQTNKGRLYRSTNSGEKWDDITDNLKEKSLEQGFVVDKIVKSQADVDVVMVAGTSRSHFISMNKGETWRRVRQKATIHTFLFHKTRPKWALLSTWTDACEANKVKKTKAKKDSDDDDDEKEETDTSPCNHILYITKDMGRTFTQVTSYVVQFSWGDVSQEQQDRIYFTHFREKKGDQPKLYAWSENVDFACTDDGGGRIQRLLRSGNKFMVSNKFIFVAKLKEKASQTVNLMVSADGGSYFKQAKLPQDLEERSYTVLDTSEGVVILHVNHGANTGNVYVSDKSGVSYTLSLPNNVRTGSGDCEFDKMLSIEGIYLANQHKGAGGQQVTGPSGKKNEEEEEADELEKSSTGTEVEKRHATKAKSKDETVVRTVISFDKGGMWSYLKAPKVDSLGKKIDCPPDRCWLHLHGITNFHNYAPFYSTENAVGIIMGTGNVGPYLRFEPDQVNTYLSRDGGLSWVEAHKGAFIYEFGDHGGLVVMADDIRKTKQVVFSWNEGQSWYDFELSQNPVEVDNVVTEPNATSTRFLLYGTRGDSGVLYHLDFSALGQPSCKGVWAADSVSSDYETWMPWDGRNTEKCMMGKQVTYTRRKQTSECFNGEKFERPVQRKNCACTEASFICEVGFKRQVDDTTCKYANDGSISVPETCTSSDFFRLNGYRKVVGDTCEGGWQPEKVSVPCPPNSKLSKGAMSVLGTIGTLAAIMAIITAASRSDKFKAYFANYGFEAFNSVRYTTIGAKAPETALDSVGARFDADFMDGDQDFADDAPTLMAYTGSSGSRRESELPRRSGGGGGGRDRDRDRERSREVPRGVDTAVSHVPKLSKPPGPAGTGAVEEDDSVDLL